MRVVPISDPTDGMAEDFQANRKPHTTGSHGLQLRLFELLPEIDSPALGQRLTLQSAAHLLHILVVAQVETSNVGDRDLLWVTAKQLDGVASGDYPFFRTAR